MARKQHSFSEQLREAIDQDERSRYRISMETGIPQGQLSRFMHDKGGLSLRSVVRVPGVGAFTGRKASLEEGVRTWRAFRDNQTVVGLSSSCPLPANGRRFDSEK